MDLNKSNLYISKHGPGFVVCIEMPDGSRNYLHNKPVYPMDNAIMIMGDFDGNLELNQLNTSIIKDESYYRIVIILKDGRDKLQRFHSRKLNVNDAASEYEMLVY